MQLLANTASPSVRIARVAMNVTWSASSSIGSGIGSDINISRRASF